MEPDVKTLGFGMPFRGFVSDTPDSDDFLRGFRDLLVASLFQLLEGTRNSGKGILDHFGSSALQKKRSRPVETV
jgi:hypothetical protein